jgi:ATP-dependent Lon protease
MGKESGDEMGPVAYPVLPLLTTVVFPGTVGTLHIIRKQSINLILENKDKEQGIVLSLAKDVSASQMLCKDLNGISVLAQIVKIQESLKDSIEVTVAAEKRVRITRFVTEEPYHTAYVDEVEEDVSNVHEQLSSTSRIAELVEKLVKGDNHYSPEQCSLFDLSRDEPGFYCDTVANRLHISLDAKQRVLSALSITQRAGILLGIVTEELQRISIENELRSKVELSIGKHQREKFLRQQLAQIRRELGDDDPDDKLIKEYFERIETSPNLPDHVRNRALLETERLKMLSPASAEYGSTKNYLDLLLQLPWNRFQPEENDIPKIEGVVSAGYYGHESVKTQILEYLAVRKLTSDIRSPVLCLAGPPGTGKTSLGQLIAEALNREFVVLNAASLTSVEEIRGTNRTFLGALPGRVIRAFAGLKSCNPVVLLDDLDKLSEHQLGLSLPLLLVELIDPRQNKTFVDHYLGLPFDLSHAIFIATIDSVDAVPESLSGRMEVVESAGYIEEEKVAIARQFIIPKLMKRHKLSASDLKFSPNAIRRIVRHYTLESGIQGLKRELEIMCRKCVRQKSSSGRVAWRVTEKNLERYLGTPVYIPEVAETQPEVGVVTGLAWTGSGGELMMVEGLKMRGSGNVITTGSLGDVMRESIQAAHSFIRSKADLLGIDYSDFGNFDVHIHFPSGGIPKDGPSAGLAVCIVIASVMSNCPIRNDIAVTGEVSLRGKVLPVSGTREKIAAAHRAGIFTLVMPSGNEKDIHLLPPQLNKEMSFVFVEKVEDVFEHTLIDFNPEVLSLQQMLQNEIVKATKNLQKQSQFNMAQSGAGAHKRKRSAARRRKER